MKNDKKEYKHVVMKSLRETQKTNSNVICNFCDFLHLSDLFGCLICFDFSIRNNFNFTMLLHSLDKNTNKKLIPWPHPTSLFL